MIDGGSAANADQLGADQLGDGIGMSAPDAGIDPGHDAGIDASIDRVVRPNIESTGGWDAYEVWRRLIKDARDRRKQQDSN